MKLKEPNPLNFYGLRQLESLPPHFEVIVVPMTYNLKESLVNWVLSNLKGRFYVGKSVEISNRVATQSLDTVLKIGFEDPKEASYFMLACPHLKYN